MASDFFRKRIPEELKAFKKLLEKKPIVLFMLAKKQAGKGTYSTWLQRLSGDKIMFVSVGDMMREAESIANMTLGKALMHDTLKEAGFPEKKIRKFIEDVSELHQDKLYPTTKIVALLEVLLQEVAEENPGRSLIIDGLPRNVDQVEEAVKLGKAFKRDGMEWFFVEVDCAEEVLEERIKQRRICPKCQGSRNITLYLTPELGYDKKEEEFYLVCDNPDCQGERMVRKPGDELGMKPYQERQDLVAEVMSKARREVPKNRYITVSNTVPVSEADDYDKNDFTEKAELSVDEKSGEVVVEYSPWVLKDDDGRKAYSRNAEPVVAELIQKIVKKLK